MRKVREYSLLGNRDGMRGKGLAIRRLMIGRKIRPVLLSLVLMVSACSRLESPSTGFCGCARPGGEPDLVANVGDRVFFDISKSSLTDTAAATVHRQALWLSKYRNERVMIAGNADERGTETYNLALGERRAAAVRDRLEAQGVAAARIQTISYGKSRPVASGHDAAAYAQNRNAVTSVDGHNPQS